MNNGIPQESATVEEMRSYGTCGLNRGATSHTVDRWANELEAANKRIAELEAELAEASQKGAADQ